MTNEQIEKFRTTLIKLCEQDRVVYGLNDWKPTDNPWCLHVEPNRPLSPELQAQVIKLRMLGMPVKVKEKSGYLVGQVTGPNI